MGLPKNILPTLTRPRPILTERVGETNQESNEDTSVDGRLSNWGQSFPSQYHLELTIQEFDLSTVTLPTFHHAERNSHVVQRGTYVRLRFGVSRSNTDTVEVHEFWIGIIVPICIWYDRHYRALCHEYLKTKIAEPFTFHTVSVHDHHLESVSTHYLRTEIRYLHNQDDVGVILGGSRLHCEWTVMRQLFRQHLVHTYVVVRSNDLASVVFSSDMVGAIASDVVWMSLTDPAIGLGALETRRTGEQLDRWTDIYHLPMDETDSMGVLDDLRTHSCCSITARRVMSECLERFVQERERSETQSVPTHPRGHRNVDRSTFSYSNNVR